MKFCGKSFLAVPLVLAAFSLYSANQTEAGGAIVKLRQVPGDSKNGTHVAEAIYCSSGDCNLEIDVPVTKTDIGNVSRASQGLHTGYGHPNMPYPSMGYAMYPYLPPSPVAKTVNAESGPESVKISFPIAFNYKKEVSDASKPDKSANDKKKSSIPAKDATSPSNNANDSVVSSCDDVEKSTLLSKSKLADVVSGQDKKVEEPIRVTEKKPADDEAKVEKPIPVTEKKPTDVVPDNEAKVEKPIPVTEKKSTDDVVPDDETKVEEPIPVTEKKPTDIVPDNEGKVEEQTQVAKAEVEETDSITEEESSKEDLF